MPLNYADWFFSMIVVLATVSNLLPILFTGAASYRAVLISVLCSKLTGFILEVVKVMRCYLFLTSMPARECVVGMLCAQVVF